jgi:SOS-response transcriptional repressor LexA
MPSLWHHSEPKEYSGTIVNSKGMLMPKRTRQEGTNFVARNLQWLLQQEQLTQQALAEATGVGQPTINRILSGKNLRPRDRTLLPLARRFDVTVDDLRLHDLSQLSGVSTLRGIKIPMVSSKIAGKVKVGSDWPDRITIYRKVSPDAFAMDVSDGGMEPRVNKGDRVVVEPRIIPQPGYLVAVRVKDQDSAIVRKFKALEATKAKRHYELHPHDQDYRQYTTRNDEIQMLGVCVERHESLIP